MMESLNLLKSLDTLSGRLNVPRSEQELFNGTKWEDFKVSMRAHFDLFSIEGDVEKLQWFVSRMTNPVKVVWAKFADNTQQSRNNVLLKKQGIQTLQIS